MDEQTVKMKTYEAMVWANGPDQPGQRASVRARSLEDARERLEARYGKGSVFNLRNEEDAARPR